MSDNFDYVDFNTLLNQAAYLGTHATEPDPGQVSAADSAFLGDDSLLDWSFSFYADTQGTYAGPSQVANAHTEGLDLYETGVGVSDESFGWSANNRPLGFQSGFNQATAPGSLYEGFDIDNTVFDAGGLALPSNALPFVPGTKLGALSEPPLPAKSVGQGFAIGSVLDTPAAPVIGQQQAHDEFALWQPDAGFDATVDQTQEQIRASPPMKTSLASSGQLQGQEAAEAPFDAVLPFPEVYRCGKCEFSTNSSWELQSHAYRTKHDIYACSKCEFFTDRSWELQSHAKQTKHATFVCKTPGCTASFVVESHLQAHEAHAHVSGHSQIEPNGMFTCAECGQAFSTRAKQQSHGNNSQHSPFLCACGATFSRVDVLHRHMDSYANDVPKFPCKFCEFHRGKHGFRRRDHLVQHLRGYHKFDEEDISEACPSARRTKQRQFATCPHRGCDLFRDESFHNLRWAEQLSQRPFATQGAFTKHMKEIHQQTPFPCDVEDCDKVGAKGYVREKDLMKHRTSKHPDVPDYSPKPRQSEYPCGLNGCDKTFSSAAGHFEHRYWVHWTSEQQRAYDDA